MPGVRASHDRRISLSEKGAVERTDDPGAPRRATGDSNTRFGDVMGDLGKRLREAADTKDEGGEG